MTVTPPPFLLGRACAKCGERGASTVYLIGSDTLRRSCRCCAYSWIETPLDRAAGPS